MPRADRVTALLPDVAYRRWLHLRHLRRPLPLRRPRTFTEKVAWRILRDRREELAWTADKLLMKERVAALGLDLVVPRVHWSGTDVGDLVGVDLPAAGWVLKPNHGSGHRGLLFGAGPLEDAGPLREATRDALLETQGRVLREWSYRVARPLLLVEDRVPTSSPDGVPDDYKLFVFDGRVRMLQHDRGRYGLHQRDMRGPDWSPLPFRLGPFPTCGDVPAPDVLPALVRAAEAIAGDLDFLRVDLYAEEGRAWFGEVAAYPDSGLMRFSPRAADLEVGSWWRLPALA